MKVCPLEVTVLVWVEIGVVSRVGLGIVPQDVDTTVLTDWALTSDNRSRSNTIGTATTVDMAGVFIFVCI